MSAACRTGCGGAGTWAAFWQVSRTGFEPFEDPRRPLRWPRRRTPHPRTRHRGAADPSRQRVWDPAARPGRSRTSARATVDGDDDVARLDARSFRRTTWGDRWLTVLGLRRDLHALADVARVQQD